MHYCIFKGVNSNDLDLFMESVPPKVRPQLRVEQKTIPGRDGVLTVSDGAYDNFVRQAEFIVFDFSRIDEITEYFSGSGWLTFDDEPEKRYRASVINQIPFSQIIRCANRIPVEFDCYPYAFESSPQTAENPHILYNLGNVESKPTIEIYGNGDCILEVNGKLFEVRGVKESATIDCENLLAYSGSSLLITKGEFPAFKIGENSLDWTADRLVVKPSWRWI